jgi:hypothetical protein
MVIYRAKIVDTKGRHIGYKLFDASSLEKAKSKKWSLVGPGRKVTKITPTRLKGTTASRHKLPRSKRFGSGYY